MSIRLIAFDLDGTLLKEDKTVSGRTMAMANAAPEVLKATAYHPACTNEEDGVAIEIETCLKEV